MSALHSAVKLFDKDIFSGLAQGNTKSASERREIMKRIKLNVKQKLSKLMAEINPGLKLK